MSKVVKFENVVITGLQVENITMKNTGDQRVKQKVFFMDEQMQNYGAEVWGQDKVTELALQNGEQVTLSSILAGRYFNGNVIYSLQIFKVERASQEQTTGAGADPFGA